MFLAHLFADISRLGFYVSAAALSLLNNVNCGATGSSPPASTYERVIGKLPVDLVPERFGGHGSPDVNVELLHHLTAGKLSRSYDLGAPNDPFTHRYAYSTGNPREMRRLRRPKTQTPRRLRLQYSRHEPT